MPEDKQLLQPSRTSDKKKNKTKKKKRKKTTPASSTTPPESSETPPAVSLPPETSPVSLLPPQSPYQPGAQLPKLRAPNKKDRKRLAGSDKRSKKHPKDSAPLLTATIKPSGGGELNAQARESLRWEGVLEDPQAEEKRLELYRVNRRQRYISHNDALIKETKCALRQTFPKESKEKNAESDQQESLPHLNTD